MTTTPGTGDERELFAPLPEGYDPLPSLGRLVGGLHRSDECEAEATRLRAERDNALAEVERLTRERDAARNVLAAAREDPDWDPGAMVMLYDQESDRADKAEAERDAMRAVVEAAVAWAWLPTERHEMLIAAVDSYQATPI